MNKILKDIKNMFTVTGIIDIIANKLNTQQSLVKLLRLNKTCYNTVCKHKIWDKINNIHVNNYLKDNFHLFLKNRLLNDVDYEDTYTQSFHLLRFTTRWKAIYMPEYINATNDELLGMSYIQKYFIGNTDNTWRDAILYHAEISYYLKQLPDYLLQIMYIHDFNFTNVYLNIGDDENDLFYIELDTDNNNRVILSFANPANNFTIQENIKKLNSNPDFPLLKKILKKIYSIVS